jgi:hypothetical protein
VLYGSEAIGGVGHVISKLGDGDPRFTRTAEGGARNTFRSALGLKGGSTVVRYAITLSSLSTDGDTAAANALAGVHATRFLSVQANYIWNRNDLTLLASSVAPAGGGFYEQARPSTQHAVFADALLYFRSRDSGVRPYLSGGLGLVRFESDAATRTLEHGMAAPSGDITATRAALRVAVGIDLRVAEAWSLRYSFSEAISGNPVSARLTPPAERNLMNFQNLFGLVLGF